MCRVSFQLIIIISKRKTLLDNVKLLPKLVSKTSNPLIKVGRCNKFTQYFVFISVVREASLLRLFARGAALLL